METEERVGTDRSEQRSVARVITSARMDGAKDTKGVRKSAVIAIVSTHTTRHLRRTLMGLAHQTRRADAVVVSCDNDSVEIAALVRECAGEFGMGILLVQRAHAGVARLGQVRNNAVRAIVQEGIAGARPETVLVFYDGDIIAGSHSLERHAVALERADFVITHRVELTEAQTAAIDEDAIRGMRPPAAVEVNQLAALGRRERRYMRQLLMRRLLPRLAKAHKPKILGSNFSMSLATYLAVNGCDEEFEGYGQEDDDLTRRLYKAGFWPHIAVREIMNYHQWHPTRAPGDWGGTPTVAMLHADRPARAVWGVDRPKAQGAVSVSRFEV